MEELSYKAKIAVIRILSEIMNADKIIHEKEKEYLDEVIKSFNLEENYEVEVSGLMTLEALSTIRGLSLEQKEYIAKMMGKMIVIDKDINYNEVKLYNAFCESCNIEKDFNVEDYPEYSLSGPFVNPEDIMND
jgi:uncharacterized tellurite resistance protein B-like protein